MALSHSWMSWLYKVWTRHDYGSCPHCVPVFMHEQLYREEANLFQPCQGQESVSCLSTVRSTHTSQTSWTLGKVWIAWCVCTLRDKQHGVLCVCVFSESLSKKEQAYCSMCGKSGSLAIFLLSWIFVSLLYFFYCFLLTFVYIFTNLLLLF